MSASTTSRPTAVPWPPLLFLGVVVGGWVAGLVYPLRWPGIDDLAARLVGYGLGAAGIALMVWALATLQRGYAVARHPAGSALTSAASFTPDMPFDLILRDGVVGARANDIRKSS